MSTTQLRQWRLQVGQTSEVLATRAMPRFGENLHPSQHDFLERRKLMLKTRGRGSVVQLLLSWQRVRAVGASLPNVLSNWFFAVLMEERSVLQRRGDKTLKRQNSIDDLAWRPIFGSCRKQNFQPYAAPVPLYFGSTARLAYSVACFVPCGSQLFRRSIVLREPNLRC